MRALCKALDEYTSSNLAALEFRALGQDRYINILKEVISYFKSYMVEFTKDEFIILMDNILDNGGNSNMLRLYDVPRTKFDYKNIDEDIRETGFMQDRLNEGNIKYLYFFNEDNEQIVETIFNYLEADEEERKEILSENN